MNEFYDVADSCVRIEYDEHYEIKDVSCTCRWTTMEMSRFKDWKKRILCKHIKKILQKRWKIQDALEADN